MSLVQDVIADFAASSPAKAAAVKEFPFGSVVRASADGPDFYVISWSDGGRLVRVVPYPVSLDISGEQYLEAVAQSVTVCAHCVRKHRVVTS